ncbi:LOW QUALITY PROTEIN: neuronal acetylcholine receptor subunit beta-2-like [Dermacentor silvarum]|uniref:LOW QUALITY PROTEIN: neuronal acetylcholine receptor subunit beta-2-like n=1 Tax=Dermacentor silvarum TaxID=543639 RepID=UPI002101299E|nr:LOW QUALITY PROTEIN: neuronal acetylcholine receptor subunit beta-2-like [Dermacentor silvarum]
MATTRFLVFPFAIFLIVLCVFMAIPSLEAKEVDQQVVKKLRQNLTDSAKYDKNYQPLNSHASDTIVNFTVYAKQLRYMMPDWDYMSLSAFVCMHWIDEGLSWNPSEYDDMREVTVADSEVWTPTLSVHESYGVYGVRLFSAVKTDHHGNVIWCPLVTFGMRCTMDLRDYPYDEHRCAMNVSSWAHGYKVKLIGKLAKKNFDQTHPDWTGYFESMDTTEFQHPEQGADPVLRFTLFVKRNAPGYHFTVVLPCVAVSILTLFIFWLPPSSGKKITLGCASIVIILLVIQNLRHDLGDSVHVPRVVQYLGTTCLAISVATLISVLVLNMVKSPMVFRPPDFLVSLLSGVPGRVLFLCPLPAPRAADHEQLADATSPLDKQDIITRQEWFLVAQGIDRVVFIMYAVFLLAYHA